MLERIDGRRARELLNQKKLTSIELIIPTLISEFYEDLYEAIENGEDSVTLLVPDDIDSQKDYERLVEYLILQSFHVTAIGTDKMLTHVQVTIPE